MLFAENILITGKVLDDQNKPLDGAKVSLMTSGLSTTTKADGSYSLTDQSIINHMSKKSTNLPLNIHNGSLLFTPSISNDFEMELFTMSGKRVSSYKNYLIQGVKYRINAIPLHLGTGFYVGSITFDNVRYSLKLHKNLNKQINISVLNSTTQKKSIAYTDITAFLSDTILFEKSGKVTQKWPVEFAQDTATTRMVTPDIDKIERDMQDIVNKYRKSNGLGTLVWSDVVANYARLHSYNIVIGAVPFGHEGFGQRVEAIGTKVMVFGGSENVVANYGVGQASFAAWLSSAGHKKNIEDPKSNLAGVGYSKGSSRYYNVYTQLFIITAK